MFGFHQIPGYIQDCSNHHNKGFFHCFIISASGASSWDKVSALMSSITTKFKITLIYIWIFLPLQKSCCELKNLEESYTFHWGLRKQFTKQAVRLLHHHRTSDCIKFLIAHLLSNLLPKIICTFSIKSSWKYCWNILWIEFWPNNCLATRCVHIVLKQH